MPGGRPLGLSARARHSSEAGKLGGRPPAVAHHAAEIELIALGGAVAAPSMLFDDALAGVDSPLPHPRNCFARAPRTAALRARNGATSFSRCFSHAPFPPP
jgi:hypothetical protein